MSPELIPNVIVALGIAIALWLIAFVIWRNK